MVMSFKYRIVERPDGGDVKTPSIPVELCWKKRLGTIALIDSGADISVISKSVAEYLGLDLSGKVHSAFGIGGKVNVVETKLSLVVNKGRERYSFRIPVKVILGDYDFPILLGREEFFENFVISFNQANERVTLKRVGRIY